MNPGEKTPVTLSMAGEPDHVPPDGVPLSITGASFSHNEEGEAI